MEEIDYDIAYLNVKDEVMNELGYTNSDLDFEEIEDKINRISDKRFHDLYEFDYNELND